MDSIVDEKKLNGYPVPVDLEKTEKIIEQMKKYVCRVALTNGTKGQGLFVKFLFQIKKKYYQF